MKKLEQMTKAGLLQRIQALENASPGANAAFEHERLLHELQVHQVELETQNRELRDAQRLLEGSRDRYADLYDFAPVGYVTLDAKGVIRELNLTAAGMLGGERARLAGVPFHLHVAHEDLARFREHLGQVEHPEERIVTELHLARKGGPPLAVMMQSVLFYDEARHSHLCRTSLTDITERRRAEAALRESEERFRQVTGAIDQVFWMTTVDKNQMLYISPAYERIWGCTCQSLYAAPRTWLDAIHPDDVSRVLQAATTNQSTGEYDVEYRIRRPDGSERWIHDRAFPIRDASGKVQRVAGVAADVTERKRLETEVVRISEEERQHIAADLHDGLCQELTALRFLTATLGRELQQGGNPLALKLRQIEDAIAAAAEQTRRVAHGLHPVVAGDGGLAGALRELAAITTRTHGIRCSFVCPRPIRIEDLTSANELYRIAQEAVRNAVRHGRASRIILRLGERGDELRLTVQDNGCGLPPEASQSGAMGLRVMCYRAGLIHGQVTIQARPRGGTEVLCRLPKPAPSS